MQKLKIIVGGLIGLYPSGGATWDYIQYPLGLKLLGHDVYYIEDTRQYPVFQKEKDAWNDATACINNLKNIMEDFGFKDHWAYKDIASGKSFGMTEEKILLLCSTADVFINISCSTFMREEYLKIPKRILIDSDPMFTQMQYGIELSGHDSAKKWTTKIMLENHNFLFSFGENIGSPDCKIPLFDFKWNTSRQPVCLDYWNNNQLVKNGSFTSIMNWSGRKKLIYNNEKWGQKDSEFNKIKDIPLKVTGRNFEVVINKPLNQDSNFDPVELKNLGWVVLQPDQTVANTRDYQNFIYNSAAEFSVAKHTYVKSNSGWFSGRSACYLAAGKPVITQDTKWTKFIHTGEGLFAFTDMESAIEGINRVYSNLVYHSKMAKEIANEYFESNKVLTTMLKNLN